MDSRLILATWIIVILAICLVVALIKKDSSFFIHQKLDKIMALDQEALDLLADINNSTNEIGEDIDALINKPDATAAEFKTALRPIADKLKGIAAAYTKEPADDDTDAPDA